MERTNVIVDRPATSWGAVLGGWVATIGASVLFAPLVAGVIAAALGAPRNGNDLALGVPVVVGILLSYVVGGYVAGRMAGYRTSWHGLMTAFFSLLVLLVLALLGAAAGSGVLSSLGISGAGDVAPNVRGLDMYAYGNAVTFGAILGFLAAIFGGWLGGLLAPPHVAAAIAPAPSTAPARERVERREVVEERPRPAQPAYARTGGERAEAVTEDEARTARIDRSVGNE